MFVNTNKNQSVLTSERSTRRLRSPVFSMQEYADAPLVSFCITHKNRFAQISETLPVNLNDNRIDAHRIEFILVDFNSHDDISSWVKREFSDDIKSGYLKFFTTEELSDWHAPLAKNTAHRLSNGKILVNLDGDNFTGYRGAAFVYNHFMSNPHDICLWQFSGEFNDGSYGRIAASRDAFMALGGYNEELLEMGFQDRDLVSRLERHGSKVILDPDDRYCRAITNEKYDPKMGYTEMRNSNKFLARRRKKPGTLTITDGEIGVGGVRRLKFSGEEFDFYNV